MDVSAATDAAHPLTKQLTKGQDEFSLAMFPLGVLTHALPTDKERNQKRYKRTFEGQVWSEQSGGMVDAVVTLSTSPDVGLPNGNDEPLAMTLINLALTHGTLDPRIRYEFVPAELIKLLGRNQSGRTWSKYLPAAFERLTTVKYKYEYAWFDYDNQEHVTRLIFGFISSSSYTEQKRNRRNAKAWFTLNDELCRRINDGRLKPLDLATYLSLKNPIAMRLYRIFDRMRYTQPTFSTDLAKFAFGNIGLSRSRHTYTDKYGNEKIDYGKIKHQLAPHLAKLEKEGTLTPATDKLPRFRKIRFGDGTFAWRIQGELRTKRHRKATKSQDQVQLDQKPDDLTAQLTQAGINPETVSQLVAQHSADHIRLQLDCLPHRLKQSAKPVTSPVGLLIATIKAEENPWELPAGYKTPEQREAARKAKAAKQQQARQQRQADQQRSEFRQQFNARMKRLWRETSPDIKDQIAAALTPIEQNILRNTPEGTFSAWLELANRHGIEIPD